MTSLSISRRRDPGDDRTVSDPGVNCPPGRVEEICAFLYRDEVRGFFCERVFTWGHPVPGNDSASRSRAHHGDWPKTAHEKLFSCGAGYVTRRRVCPSARARSICRMWPRSGSHPMR